MGCFRVRCSPCVVSSGLPAPQSVMGHSSSKVSASNQEKDKCKVSNKRFVRPSSYRHKCNSTLERNLLLAMLKAVVVISAL